MSSRSHHIGWSWKNPKGTASHAFSTADEARDNAVYNAIVSQKKTGASAVYHRMSDTERFLCWQSLQRAGWQLLEVKAEF
ncbi:hypothetical protein [Halocynthiibacter styelae]|uniref:Uncharacterized protein n=1 Tax=Halocynthiibacter styelae TaxID=2761955 RepID=A0A8J7J8K3_9RHOB|nr:hypothetical protein [Paenihalocynthiibacter styelae]MBI1495390.1 hypothetical protein [Paenihalocynthiibacter styelae]